MCYPPRVLATLDQRADAFRRSIRANVVYWRTALRSTTTATPVTDHVWQSVIRAILFACEERSARVEAAQLAIGLFGHMQHRGAWHEWSAILQRVANALTEESALRSRVLGQVGQCLFLDGRPERAVEILGEAEHVALAVGDQELIVRNRVSLAESLRLLRRTEPAERIGRLALEGLAQLEDSPQFRLVKMAALTTLGMVLGFTGRPDEGLPCLRQAAQLAEADQRFLEASRIAINIAHVLWTADRLLEALPVLDQALASLASLPDATSDRATISLTRGSIYLGLGRLQEAESALQAIEVDVLRTHGFRSQVAVAAHNLGNVYRHMGRLPEAEAKLIEALALHRELDDEVEVASVLITLGDVLEEQGKRGQAEPMWREAVDIAEKYPDDTWAQQYVAKGRRCLAS